MKDMSQRQKRVSELVRQSVAECLNTGMMEVPGIPAILTVVDVWTSADLRLGRVFLSTPMLSDETPTVLKELNSHAHEFQRILNRKLNLKYTPKLTFFWDKSLDEDVHMSDVFKKMEHREGWE